MFRRNLIMTVAEQRATLNSNFKELLSVLDKESVARERSLGFKNRGAGSKYVADTTSVTKDILNSVMCNLHLVPKVHNERVANHSFKMFNRGTFALLLNEQGHTILEFLFTCLPKSTFADRAQALTLLAIMEAGYSSPELISFTLGKMSPRIASQILGKFGIELEEGVGLTQWSMDKAKEHLTYEEGVIFVYGKELSPIQIKLATLLDSKLLDSGVARDLTNEEYDSLAEKLITDDFGEDPIQTVSIF